MLTSLTLIRQSRVTKYLLSLKFPILDARRDQCFLFDFQANIYIVNNLKQGQRKHLSWHKTSKQHNMKRWNNVVCRLGFSSSGSKIRILMSVKTSSLILLDWLQGRQLNLKRGGAEGLVKKNSPRNFDKNCPGKVTLGLDSTHLCISAIKIKDDAIRIKM